MGNLINKKEFNIPQDPKYLEQKFLGSMSKTLTEEMVCLLQESIKYLTFLDKNKVNLKQTSLDPKNGGNLEMIKIVQKFHKYLNRLDDIVQRQSMQQKKNIKKYSKMTEDQIFIELDKVIQCQMNIELSPQQVQEMLSKPSEDSLFTNIPLVDIILNIDKFTAHLEDRLKIIRILKELFQHCTSMKKLLLKHGKLIITRLIKKYDKMVVIIMPIPGQEQKVDNGPSATKSPVKQNGNLESRDEFVANSVGSILRLYTKSKSLSQCFEDFKIIESIVDLMKNEQFVVQSDAQKTFDSILKGQRINEDLSRPDRFVQWIENDTDCGEIQRQDLERGLPISSPVKTHEKLNSILSNMRQSDSYTFKRTSLKLQYELLTYGLQNCIEFISTEHKNHFGEGDNMLNEGDAKSYFEEQVPSELRGQYYNFASYFVDNKENLKDIMQQLGSSEEGEERIKEELFLMLSFFILTFEYRQHRIRNLIIRNKRNYIGIIEDFQSKCENEECQEMLVALNAKLSSIGENII